MKIESHDNPLITVLIPMYNAESFIKNTIDSVLYQTFTHFEILVLDDSSIDSSAEIIKSYDDSRVKYIACSHDFIKTLNHGLQLAKGKYIALLDHDDLMMPYRLQIQYDYLESNLDIVACGGYMHSFGMYSKLIEAPLEHDEILKEMIKRSPMLNPTGFIRRDVLGIDKVKYEYGYSFAADFKFWSDLIKIGKIANIPIVLTLYRTSKTQTSILFSEDSTIGTNQIQHEIVEYLFSLIGADNEFYSILDEKFLPGLNELGSRSFFSPPVYFLFMYELIRGLNKSGAINVSFHDSSTNSIKSKAL
ncbi:glycosyltransferase family 2 protein [Dysgonomonas sp. ZJ709]|uniref:glycosyltransferase family 2 protein n=1 Tax=Dysgonomonas sp. ZJ709 TaxID=2709797 RepID=UPI0013EC86DA|nr:glycosyltransferase family 2 protein [Dysgonomonas sp. ZJ709]